MADSPGVPPAAANRQRSGCLTVIYVVLGLGALTTVCLALGTWLFMRSETGKKVMETARQTINLTKDAARAPGTAELRQRGCEQAMVMPIGQLVELFTQLAPATAKEIRREDFPGNGTMVLCQLDGDRGSAPGCAEVARIYADAVPESPETFGVVVQHQGKPVCQGTFARDGTLVEPFERKRK